MDWRKVLACITGAVDEALLLCNEYPAAENRILMEQLQGRLRLTAPQRTPWLKLAAASGERRWQTWRISSSQKQSSHGMRKLVAQFREQFRAA
jgi:hypothetical protein